MVRGPQWQRDPMTLESSWHENSTAQRHYGAEMPMALGSPQHRNSTSRDFMAWEPHSMETLQGSTWHGDTMAQGPPWHRNSMA